MEGEIGNGIYVDSDGPRGGGKIAEEVSAIANKLDTAKRRL